MSTLYCPRCDRRLTPDHRCLSRRVFLGMLGLGGAATTLAEDPLTNDLANMVAEGAYRPIPAVVAVEYATLGTCWLAPSAFNALPDKAMRDTLRQQFPDGATVTEVNGRLVQLVAEMSAWWTR